jgi:formylglycine-generating enzyme required for sulfatase activity
MLIDSFDEEEIRTLTFDLQVDYDSLPGRGKAAKVRDLIANLQRNGRIPELVAYCAKNRPHLDWSDQSANSPPELVAAASKRRTIWIALGALALVLFSVIAFFLLRPPTFPLSEGMIEIKADTYPDRLPETADAHNFWIDRYEVTNAQYQETVSSYDFPPNEDNLPAHNISWDDANAYCLKLNKRLPTEAEWVLAARGPNGWLYPWGDDGKVVSLPSHLYPVGTVPINRSYFGVFDMFSNVAEWVDEPFTAVSGDQKVSRGSAYDQPRDLNRALPGDPNSTVMIATSGVRCAADLVEPISSLELAEAAEQTGIGRDEFTTEDAGWPSAPAGDDFVGYHRPDYYHMSAVAENEPITAIFSDSIAPNFILESDVFVDMDVAQAGGDYRYGLAFRYENGRYYAFVIDLFEQSWAVLKYSDAGTPETLAFGTSKMINGIGNTTPIVEDKLTVIANGPALTFLIDGQLVGHINNADISGNQVGFFGESLDGQLGHFHFDRIFLQAIVVSDNSVVLNSASGLVAVGEGIGTGSEDAIAEAIESTPEPEETVMPVPTATTAPEPTGTAVPTPNPTATTLPSPTPEPTELPVPDGMVLIPSGNFLMGSLTGETNEQPEHLITLDTYFIDQFEVSNGQYLACVAEESCAQANLRNSLRRSDYRDNPTFASYPVVGVTWQQAVAYCAWAEKRLPTEAEWEYAAGGVENFVWPWGNTFDGSLSAATALDTDPVDDYPDGVSPFGIFNMAGNVNEWVQDRYASDFYANSPVINPVNLDSGSNQIYRGGSFDNSNGAYFTTSRRYVVSGNSFDVDIGFRCAQDAP